MRSGFNAALTDSTWITARWIGTSNGARLARAMVSTTRVPGTPRSRCTTSSMSMPTVGCPSALMMVARLDAGAGRRGAVDRGDHLRHPVLDRDLDADAAELAARRRHQLRVFALFEIVRMRVEPSEHAF